MRNPLCWLHHPSAAPGISLKMVHSKQQVCHHGRYPFISAHASCMQAPNGMCSHTWTQPHSGYPLQRGPSRPPSPLPRLVHVRVCESACVPLFETGVIRMRACVQQHKHGQLVLNMLMKPITIRQRLGTLGSRRPGSTRHRMLPLLVYLLIRPR